MFEVCSGSQGKHGLLELSAPNDSVVDMTHLAYTHNVNELPHCEALKILCLWGIKEQWTHILSISLLLNAQLSR